LGKIYQAAELLLIIFGIVQTMLFSHFYYFVLEPLKYYG